MPKKETLDTFLNNINSLDNIILKEVIRGFNQVTQNVLSYSQDLVPIASGTLERSGAVKQAKQTSKGIVSSVFYKANYALKVHDGLDGIKLKNAGKVSYYDDGQKWIKERKGVFGFLQKSVDKYSKNLMKQVSNAIDRSWDKL